MAQPGPAERIARLPAAKVLERIGRARLQRDELDAELTPRSESGLPRHQGFRIEEHMTPTADANELELC